MPTPHPPPDIRPGSAAITRADRPDRAGTTPPHHAPEGGFRNPWPGNGIRGGADLLKWFGQRLRSGRAFRSEKVEFERGAPSFDAPRADPDVLTATWVGHSTVLLQLGGLNVLTDPMWSRRASPIPLLGPRRVMPPGVRLQDLPPIDLVLQSHNHYDHLDVRTVKRLRKRHAAAPWVAPLGLRPWLLARGVREAWELDWWDTLHVAGAAVTPVPARHFSARGLRDRMQTLWCGFVLEANGWRVFFAGDSGMHPEWRMIGERLGPFDLMMIPIGAYEPRWFMEPAHMNPEEAVEAYREVEAGSASRAAARAAGGAMAGSSRGVEARGAPPAGKIPATRHPPVMLPIHWGTFPLTDEPLAEPPVRTRAAWEAAGLDAGLLRIPPHGGTVRLRRAP